MRVFADLVFYLSPSRTPPIPTAIPRLLANAEPVFHFIFVVDKPRDQLIAIDIELNAQGMEFWLD